MAEELPVDDTRVVTDAAVHAPAAEAWLTLALGIVETLARSHKSLTTDDVWRVLDDRSSILPRPAERRALGAVMREAARRQLVVATTHFVTSRRVACHRRPVRNWVSLVFHQRPS